MPARTYPLAGLLFIPFFLSGAAALAFEALWVRGLTLILGSTSRSLSCVVTAFLLGHAAGAWLAARRLPPSPKSSIRAYGYAELGAALLGMSAVAWCFHGGHSLVALRLWLPGPGVAGDFLLACLVFGPASAAFGATLPLVARAASGRIRISLLYAVNLFGAALGPLLASWGVAQLGATATGGMAALTGVAAAAWALRMTAALPDREAPKPAATPNTRSAAAAQLRLGLAVAATSGFLVLSAQVAWVRLFGLLVGDRVFVTAIALSCILFGLGAGGMIASSATQRRSVEQTLTLSLSCTVASLAAALVLADPALLSLHPDSPDYERSAPLVRAAFVLTAVVLPAIGLGTLFPLALSLIERTAQLRSVGTAVAYNTVTGALGALSTAYFLSGHIGTRGILVLHVILCALLAVVASRRGVARGGRALIVGVVGGFAALALWKRGPALGVVHPRLRAIVQEDASGIFEAAALPGGRVAIFNTGSRLAGELGRTSTADTQRYLAITSAHFAPRLEQVAVLGMGYGISAGAMARGFGATRVDGVDVLPAVFDSLWRYQSYNDAVHLAPNLHALVMDGRRYLHGQVRQQDAVIVSVHQYRTQGASLATAEFFAQARRALRDDGVLVQYVWGEDAAVVLASAAQSFEEMRALALAKDEAIIVFSARPVRANPQQREPVSLQLAQTALGTHAQFEQRLLQGEAQLRRWRSQPVASLHTDDHPVLEFRRSPSIGTFRVSLSPPGG